jgi:hypothetical protein
MVEWFYDLRCALKPNNSEGLALTIFLLCPLLGIPFIVLKWVFEFFFN